ncbi:MICOS complex subunit MIC25 isoform X2 [Poecile atricapillus]|uniref:MICOS complex subunit MIC25 isoform X2 n=1 Tax=Poecile atricapillus TaxID=48891 RepID=UPI002738D2C1|nr:MICOS complex subunit MIC25 isoform X2 [Poecile atricapillus]
MGSGYVGRRCEGTGAAGSRCRRGARRGQETPDSMGGCESSHGGRRVSFGVDEREQVRVLQGIRLTEDVVNRMKGSPQSKRCFQKSPRASNGTAPSSLAAGVRPRSPGIQPPKASDSAAEHELYRRYEQEQALVQEELLHLARREREAASEAKERNSINEERQRTAQMAMELQDREAELKLQEAFYKDQLARIEKKLCTSGQVFYGLFQLLSGCQALQELGILYTFPPVILHSMPARRRNADPVCSNLQSEILKCYRENKHEVLKCSELAKEYQRCVSAAQKTCSRDQLMPTVGQSFYEEAPKLLSLSLNSINWEYPVM